MIAFLVDGHMEQRIVQRLCPGAPVRLINLNGEDASVEAIAKRVATLFRLFNNRYHPVVVVVDREGRELSVGEIKQALVSSLERLNLPLDQFVIGVADRMIENWILADPECGCGSEDAGEACEGTDGKARIKELLKQNGSNYHETTVGVDLFCNINPNTALRNSRSFEMFCHSMRIHCDWLSKRLV